MHFRRAGINEKQTAGQSQAGHRMNVIEKVRRRISPLYEVMGARQYRSAVNAVPFATGQGQLFGEDISFSDGAGFLHSVQEIFYQNVYKFKARTDTPHIIDAGANIGLSLIYFKRLYPRCTIVAYEPDAAIFDILSRNVAHYDGIELRRSAAWIADTELTFYSEGSLAGSSEIDFVNKGNAVIVSAERLKDELAKAPVDFLKIDIEGAENSVLFDIEDELAQVDHLFFEYHSLPGKPQSLGDLLNIVTRAGFRYVIKGARAPKLPFIESFATGFDLQLDVSCFRRA